MTTVGMDAGQLEAFALRLDRAAGDLEGLLREGVSSVALATIGTSLATIWRGPRAEDFARLWQARHLAKLRGLERMLHDAARDVRREAHEQREASKAEGGFWASARKQPNVDDPVNHIRGWLDPGGFGVTHSDLEKIRDELKRLSPAERDEVFSHLTDAEVHRLLAQMNDGPLKGGFDDGAKYVFLAMLLPSLSDKNVKRLMGDDWAKEKWRGPADLPSKPDEFGASAFDRLQHGGISDDEIEIRRLDNGKYVVFLPGVMDLTDGLKKGAIAGGAVGGGPVGVGRAVGATVATWDGTNTPNSARDMHFARRSEMNADNGSEVGTNAYAFAVKEALMRRGVPAGADVMLVGHSFGAYTALELAGDPTFNDAFGAGTNSAYHVNVTHVLAGGADAAFRLDGVPPHTQALLLNNKLDAAYNTEAALPGNAAEGIANWIAPTDGHRVEPFAGGFDGAGHQLTNYAGYFKSPSAPSEAFIADAAKNYSGGGEAIHVTVKDAYREPVRP